MFDVKQAEAEAKKELAKEKSTVATTKIKAQLKRIEAAEAIVANERRTYALLLADIGADV